ncbi:MAG TPA: hypothetical protein VJX10_00675 [Pseudonocardiaceae bacterium]|nr:hypothetical protein [Pseudonocardiaceae bacterium]
MSDGNAEQERLLAEALRAQAVRAPLADPTARGPDDQVLKLFSGPDALLSGRASDTVGLPPVAEPGTTHLDRRSAQLPAGWIVLLAVLLGLAAGAVVGLVSVL